MIGTARSEEDFVTQLPAWSGPYVVRYGFSPGTVTLVLANSTIAAGFGWASWTAMHEELAPDDDIRATRAFAALTGLLAVVLGAMVLDWLFTMLTRRVALRIDQDGVTLGRRTGRTDPHRQCAVVRHCANRAVRAEAGRTDPDVRAAAAA